ncbi:DUF853 family protein, partial [Pseudoxanthomonas sp. SGD-10]
TYPASDFYEIDKVLTSLGTGEALITVLNEKGSPTEVVAVHLIPPTAIMGPMSETDCNKLMQASDLYAKYQETLDPVSAYEILTQRIEEKLASENRIQEEARQTPSNRTSSRAEKSAFEKVINAPITRQIGREIVRGLFGMITGKKTSKKKNSFFGF